MRRIAARAINILLALSVAAPLASAVTRGPPTAVKESFGEGNLMQSLSGKGQLIDVCELLA